MSAREAIANALACVQPSPAQENALDELVARYPATHFDVVERDRFSCALVIECEDGGAIRVIAVTANGKVMQDA